MRRRSLVVVALLVLLAGCEASCSTATLSEPAIATAVDAATRAPIDPGTTFPSSTGSLHATIHLASAPADTAVAAHFFYLEEGEQEIASDEIVTAGAGTISFALNPPATGWPVGRYEVRYLLNGEFDRALGFAITADAPAAPPTGPGADPGHAPAPPAQTVPRPPDDGFAGAGEPAVNPADTMQQPGPDAVEPGSLDESLAPGSPPSRSWQRLADDNLGFSLEVPGDWGYRVLDSGAYIIEGPQGTEAYEVSIIIQVIDRAANPGSSTMAQYQEAFSGVQVIPDVEILAEELRPIAGQRAPYFMARYTGRDSQGGGAPFGHAQFVLEGARYWYWVSVMAPIDIYRNNQDAIDRAIATFRID